MKAVIPAAGLGTRILPATKAIPKELLCLVDRPMIQYVVEEAAAAGIRDVVIVTSPGKDALAEHFGPSPELERALEDRGKRELLDAVRAVSELANVSFVIQDEPLGLGHAVWCARDAVGTDPFAVLLPDELFGGPDLLRTLTTHHERFSAPVIAVMQMPPDEISNYGVVDGEVIEADLVRMRDFVEKPSPQDALSDLGSVGRYVLTTDVLDALSQPTPGAGGEIQLTDAIAAVARATGGYAHVHRGERHDVGRPLGYFKAVVHLALEHPDIGPDVRAFLSELQM